MTNASTRLIGAHVSAAGGIDKAVERAAAIGCTCVQVFSGSPRVWQRAPLQKIDVDKVFSKQKELLVESIFTHSLYLVNFASDNPELVAKSSTALLYDLVFDSKLQGSGVILHTGSHQGRGWEAVRENVLTRLASVLTDAPADSTLLIENAAGQNGKIGSDLGEIQWLIENLADKRVGWCCDTCHAWAAGIPLTDLANQMEDAHLVESLKCIHVNDSRDPFASGRDRHANLGEGSISSEDFTTFLCDSRVVTKPLVLEVPGEDKQGPDAVNVERLKALLS